MGPDPTQPFWAGLNSGSLHYSHATWTMENEDAEEEGRGGGGGGRWPAVAHDAGGGGGWEARWQLFELLLIPCRDANPCVLSFFFCFPSLISLVSISIFLLYSFSLFPPFFLSFSPLFFFFFSLSVFFFSSSFFFFFSLLLTSFSTLSSPVFIGKYMGREAYYPCPIMA